MASDYYLKSQSIEYSDQPEELFFESLGLSGNLAGLEGWGFFKKVWKGVKKVVRGGKKLFRKLKISKLLKVAIPVVGAIGLPFLSPLIGAATAKLAARFGPRVAGLIKGGFTKPALVKNRWGKVVTTLVDSAEHRRIMKQTGNKPLGVLSWSMFRNLTGRSETEREIPGAKAKRGKIEIPVFNSPQMVSASDSTQPPPPPPGTSTPASSFMIPAAILGAALLMKK